MKLINRLVQRNMFLNKKRTIVTVVGIILSVALLSALTTMVSSFQKSLVNYEKGKTGDYHVLFTGVPREELSQFNANRGIQHFYIISDMGTARLEGSKNSYKPYAHFIGMSDVAMERAKFRVIEGRLPQNENEVVVSRHVKTNGRVVYAVGDVLTFQVGRRVERSTGREIEANQELMVDQEVLVDCTEKEYTVVGIMERPGYGVEAYSAPGYTFLTYSDVPSNKVTVYVRYNKQGLKHYGVITGAILGVNPEAFDKVFVGRGKYGDITDKEADELIRQLAEAKYGMDLNEWLIRYEKLWPLDSAFVVIFFLACIVAVIIIVTSVYCIKNSFEISITEKIRQYGMLASIGATKRQIRKCVYREATLMAYAGIPVGILSGLLAAFLLVRLSEYLLWDSLQVHLIFQPAGWAIVISVILGLITIYASALGSAVKASKVSPLEAIRNQREIVIRKKKLRTPGYVGKLFGIGGVITYKSLKRNRKKYRTTVVSIVICTVTFIVVSYFMSMSMDLVNLSYTDSRYNLSFGLSLYDGGEFDDGLIQNLSHVEEYSIQKRRWMYCENPVYTEKMKEYIDKAYQGGEFYEAQLQVIAMDDASFERYAKECGVHSDAKEKVILVNNQRMEENKARGIHDGYVNVYDFKKGDHIKIFIEEYEEETQEYHFDFEIHAITDKRPLGSEGAVWSQFLVISDTMLHEKNMEKRMGTDYTMFFISDNADVLQDDIEEIILPRYDGNTGYSMYNRDKGRKDEQSLFLLLEIFAYGLILVIGLIGITNIINTLGTSVELRGREFATLRSVGMTDKQFQHMIRLESLFTAGKSLLIGVSLGMLISFAICKLEGKMDAVIPFHPPITAAVIVSVTVLLLIYMIIRISLQGIMKRNIIETIKNENV